MNEKIIFVSGHFNVLHPGHLRLLRFAKEYGGKLIVAVESDRIAGDAAYVSQDLRLEGIQSNSLVNEAFIFDEPVEEVIKRLKPHIVIKGKEHELRLNPEQIILDQYGGKLLFSSGETFFSSIDLIKKEFHDSETKNIFFPEDYLLRHDIIFSKLIKILNGFSKLKICVIGDLIIDEYITCQPLGMSQEDPTIVVTPIDSKYFIGGAGIVAAHAAGLGAKVHFFSVTGEDKARQFAQVELDEIGVNSFLLIDESRPTTLKQRFRSKGKSMLRVSYLHQEAISMKIQKSLLAKLEEVIDDIDLLVFSDFNYGCLPKFLIEQIIILAKSRGIMLAADSQSSSQIGDISRFKGMDLLTPTEREARISVRNHEDGLIILAEQLRLQAEAENILLKLGEEGLLIHPNNRDKIDCTTDRITALNSAPKDVAGAGDSLLITSAMALVSNANIWEASFLGSLAAAIQVGRLGNKPLQLKEFISILNKL
jgi:rfaE bifunctional protein kinase chain/domain